MDNQVSSVWFDNKLLRKLIRKLLTDKKWKLITELFLALAQWKWIRRDGRLLQRKVNSRVLLSVLWVQGVPYRQAIPERQDKYQLTNLGLLQKETMIKWSKSFCSVWIVFLIGSIKSPLEPTGCWCEALTWLGGLILDRTNKKVLPSPFKLLAVYVAHKN